MRFHSDSPVEILERCIEDIRNGQWVCDNLTLSVLVLQGQKPMGCAIGLAGINSGNALIKREEFEGEQYVGAELHYPADSDWTSAGQETVFYLSEAIPEEDRAIFNPTKLGHHQANVIEYNDGFGLTKKNAEKWFTDALELAKKAEAVAGEAKREE